MLRPSLKLVFPTKVYLPVSITAFIILLRLDATVKLLRKHPDTQIDGFIFFSLLDFPMLDKIIDRWEPLAEKHFSVKLRAGYLADIAIIRVIDQYTLKSKVSFSCDERYIKIIDKTKP